MQCQQCIPGNDNKLKPLCVHTRKKLHNISFKNFVQLGFTAPWIIFCFKKWGSVVAGGRKWVVCDALSNEIYQTVAGNILRSERGVECAHWNASWWSLWRLSEEVRAGIILSFGILPQPRRIFANISYVCCGGGGVVNHATVCDNARWFGMLILLLGNG